MFKHLTVMYTYYTRVPFVLMLPERGLLQPKHAEECILSDTKIY
jgi:hypothetical protein